MNNLLTIENLPSRTRQLILTKADGNPFFVEEIMRTLIDKGVVRSENGRWRATSAIETLTIPDTIQGVIMARIDRLDEEVKQILKAASVIGRAFLYRLLKEVTEAVRELDRHLDSLTASELIREKQKVPELEYIFKHALVQESTYESILLKKRQELHGKVASAIETLFSDRLDEFAPVLAYHYAKAKRWEKAQEYLFKAGDQAGRIAADAEALTHYQQALESYAKVFGDRWDPIQRGILERKMGEAFYRRGDYQTAMEYLKRALAYLGRPELPASRPAVGLGIFREISIRFILDVLSRRLIKKTYGSIDQAGEEVVRIYHLVGMIDVGTGAREQALLATLKSLNFSERKGFAAGAAGGYAGLGFGAWILCLPRPSRFLFRRAAALAGKSEDSGYMQDVMAAFTLTSGWEGRLEEAIGHASKEAELYHSTGSRDISVHGLAVMWASSAHLYLGNFGRSLTLARELIHLGEDGNNLISYIGGLACLGHIQERKGEFEEAVATLKKVIELSEAIPHHDIRGFGGYILGGCYLRMGNFERSLNVLTETDNWMAKHHYVKGISPIYVSLGLLQVYLAAAEHAVEGNREEWLKKARRSSKKLFRLAKFRAAALPESIRSQGIYYWLRGKTSAAKECWERSLKLAEEMGMRYDLGMTHFEMGKRLNDHEHLRKAEAIFAEIGAKFDLGETRKLLQPVAERKEA